MSAICGIVGIHEPLAHDEIRHMLSNLVAYAPDRIGFFAGDSIQLGQVQRFNTPESLSEVLPLEDEIAGPVIVADVRLDNREELFAALGIPTSEHRTMPDSKLILLAYQKWGKLCPSHLLGDFIFAIWDKRMRKLFCARDHFGQRVLYYTQCNGGFYFASVAKGITTLPMLKRELNEQKLADFLVLMAPDPEETFFLSVKRLPAAHLMEVTSAGVHVERYWSYSRTEIHHRSEAECLEEFRALFAEAVRCRLRSSYPLGSHLSGGLDSSSTTAMAATILKQQGQVLTSFGSVPPQNLVWQNRPGWRNNDSDYMYSVQRQHPNIDLALVQDHHKTTFSDIDRFHAFTDVPFLNPCNRTWVETILENAQHKNIRTMLTGAMGNMTISWRGIASPTIGTSVRSAAKKARTWWRRRVLGQSPWSHYSGIHPIFARQMKLQSRFTTHSFLSCEDPREWQLCRGAIHDTMSAYNAQRAIFGVEYRDPSHDKRIVEFCLSLPQNRFCDGKQTRLLIRRAMENILPRDVQWRWDNGGQAADWMHRLFATRDQMGEQLEDFSHSSLKHYLDIGKLGRILKNCPHPEVASFKDELVYRYLLQRSIFVGHFARSIHGRKTDKQGALGRAGLVSGMQC